MATALGAGDVFRLVRTGIDVGKVHAHVRKPFRFLLCGDPGLVSDVRRLLLSGHPDESVPLDAAACLETYRPDGGPPVVQSSEIRLVLWVGRRGDLAGAEVEHLKQLGPPVFAVTVDDAAQPSGPAVAPASKMLAEYVVRDISKDAMRGRLFPHIVEACKGVEVAVGRRLPPMRESVAAKLTRDAANTALKISIASALVDHIPVFGVVLGAFASAGDMVAITGVQMMLLLNIQAVYGDDPDVGRMWQLLPVIGGGFGWRTLARELVGFVPVAGVAIKGAIAYAGTIVVGEGVTFFMEHGRPMDSARAKAIYDRTKADAMRFAKNLATRFKRGGPES